MSDSRQTFGKPAAAVYNRVSTPGQDPEPAMTELHRAAVQRGYEVVLAVAETGSGRRNDRPGMLRVLDAARRGQLAAVFVSRLDRFGRSSLDLLANIRALTDAGVRFACVEQAIDVQPGRDPMGQLVLTALAGVAEFEHALITARVREGQARARKRGVVFGRPRVDGPDPAAIAELRAAGRSWRSIAIELRCTIAMARRRAGEATKI